MIYKIRGPLNKFHFETFTFGLFVFCSFGVKKHFDLPIGIAILIATQTENDKMYFFNYNSIELQILNFHIKIWNTKRR